MTDTREDIAIMAYERNYGPIEDDCQSGDPYCARNHRGIRNTYERYVGSICGACEDALRYESEPDILDITDEDYPR